MTPQPEPKSAETTGRKLTRAAFRAWLVKQPKRRAFTVMGPDGPKPQIADMCPVALWLGDRVDYQGSLLVGGTATIGRASGRYTAPSWIFHFALTADEFGRSHKGRITAARALKILGSIPRGAKP